MAGQFPLQAGARVCAQLGEHHHPSLQVGRWVPPGPLPLPIATPCADPLPRLLPVSQAKIQERVAILGKKKLSLLYSEVPQAVLPTSLGGEVDMEAGWEQWVQGKVEAAHAADPGASEAMRLKALNRMCT
jgi:hypothetical protein